MNLAFYTLNQNYCDYLRTVDSRVPHVMDEKENRPFVGIIIQIQDINYYAPLTSPKPKHLTMKNQVDFIKINNGVWGAINLNNMIPVHPNNITKIIPHIAPNDKKDIQNYKNLLANQLSWCNTNKEQILRAAQKLYTMISEGKSFPNLASRCCDFKALETAYKKHCVDNAFEISASI